MLKVLNKLLDRISKVDFVCFCKTLFFVLAIGLLFNSCKKETVIDLDSQPKSLSDIFAHFWLEMNERYLFWDKETTNWDSVYKIYKPKFDELGNNDEDKTKALSYFEDLTGKLIDHHFSITFNEAPLSGTVINPALSRKVSQEAYRSRYSYNSVVQTYLDKGFFSGVGNISQNGVPIRATTGTIGGDIRYFHCNFFALKRSYFSEGHNQIKQILNSFFSAIRDRAKPKGVILDLRDNSGGDLGDLNFLAGKLINRDVLFGYSRSKMGTGKLNYLPWLEARLKHDRDFQLDVPIILLGDNYTASLSEIMILALRSKTNVFIGEQTFGATGLLSDPDIFNSGSFQVGTFLTVTTSAVEFKGANGVFYEGVGLTPDIFSQFNFEQLSKGKDIQLELAIHHINGRY
uniref:S41 family peptidase n=1 Tax=Pedobacter schmidteae TaxID=2201271 RepID=UPI000EAF9E11|nr:S41 family peptidase [Pedobacter schmidteae]